jgi:hypothetical protein
MDSVQESPCLSVASKKEGRRDGHAERTVVVGITSPEILSKQISPRPLQSFWQIIMELRYARLLILCFEHVGILPIVS